MLLLCCALLLAFGGLAMAQDDDLDLEELLEQVGENYARGYLAPLSTGFGVNQNSALFHTAEIPGSTLKIDFGFKVMASKLSDDDKTFSTVTSVTLDERYGINPGHPAYNQTGQLVVAGPTVFGDPDAKGSITAYYAGLPVYAEDGIEGLVDTDYVPLVMPQASVSGLMGLRATVRWLPDIELDADIGSLKLWGFGLSASANYWLPTLPVDVSAGYFNQQLDIGEYLQTDAKAFYVACSKNYAAFTFYGALSKEESSIEVAYDYTYDDDGTPTTESIDFKMDGVQEKRFTLGATLNAPLKLNFEMGFGELTTYSAGLMISI
jgi:hypothetical protein